MFDSSERRNTHPPCNHSFTYCDKNDHHTKIFIRFIKEELVPLCFAKARSWDVVSNFFGTRVAFFNAKSFRRRTKKACSDDRQRASVSWLNCKLTVYQVYLRSMWTWNFFPHIDVLKVHTLTRVFGTKKRGKKMSLRFTKWPPLNLKINGDWM